MGFLRPRNIYRLLFFIFSPVWRHIYWISIHYRQTASKNFIKILSSAWFSWKNTRKESDKKSNWFQFKCQKNEIVLFLRGLLLLIVYFIRQSISNNVTWILYTVVCLPVTFILSTIETHYDNQTISLLYYEVSKKLSPLLFMGHWFKFYLSDFEKKNYYNSIFLGVNITTKYFLFSVWVTI